MASTFSKKDLEEIKPYLDKTVYKFLGFSEPSVVNTATNCLLSGYDKEKTAKTLSSLLDDSKALKLTEKVFDVANKYKATERPSRKRQKEEEASSDLAKKQKIIDGNPAAAPPLTMVSHLSQNQIRDMMASAQRLIEEKKKALTKLAAAKPTPAQPLKVLVPSSQPQDKLSKIAMLQANIKNKLSSGLLNSVLNNGAAIPPPSDKPTPLILDSHGRTVDITGKEIQLTHHTPTLKANIRAKKREEFKAQFNQQVPESISEAGFYDPRVPAKPAVRNKRALRFHEPGKFQQLAERMRMKAQLERLQGEIFQIAKKTGISSAAKMALIAPKAQSQEEQVPDQEWWDSVITINGYGEDSDLDPINLRSDAVSHLVEHPTQMRPPTDPLKPVFLPVFLTKKERKKLRRQNRREAWKEEQEKIRLGLEPPPEPKLRISNLMRVLGTEAVQDPTKMEAHVRAQMAKRQKAHEDANAARKLTTEQRKEKKIRKLQEDTTLVVHVAVYRVTELSNPAKKFKVETNANQLFLTGCVVLFKDCNVVVVEGGPKQINKYNRLMTHRIKWEEDAMKHNPDTEAINKCVLVWKGTVKQRTFGEMKFKVCPSEKLARDHLKKLGVEHYWDLAYSGSVLEHSDDLF